MGIRRTEKRYLQKRVSGIEILRESAINRLKARGYSTIRIIWTIYCHEKRCAHCQRLIEIRDRGANVTPRNSRAGETQFR